MSVRIVRESVAGARALFAKTFELFTGGFGWATRATDDHTEGVTLPAGSLLTIDEENRTAYPVKRGRLATNYTAGSAVHLEHGHLFEVGDTIGFLTGTGADVAEVEDLGDYDYVRTDAAMRDNAMPTGTVITEGTASALVGTANAIAAYPTTIEEGASVSVIRRGTVYSNRIPPTMARDEIATGAIQFSDSQ